MWDGCIEAGDIARVVGEGYVHVIGDVRGSGASEGEHIGNYNAGGVSLGQDAYDFIEWVAAQPWCDGNVGMIGISYFGSMQVSPPPSDRRTSRRSSSAAATSTSTRRPTTAASCGSCRAPPARAAAATPAGRSPTAIKSRMLETYSPDEIAGRVAERLADPDVAAWPNLVHVLHYPKHHEAWFDIIMNELDGDVVRGAQPDQPGARTSTSRCTCRSTRAEAGRSTARIELFEVLKGPKKLEIGPYPPMQTRPWVEEHDTMFRWYDYWLKGIDNGIMDEPAVKVFVEGTREA